MQIDRILSRTVSRLAVKGLSRGITKGLSKGLPFGKAAPAEGDPAAAGQPAEAELRGSGSWANEWDGPRSAMERAKALATPARKRKGAVPTPAEPIPEGTVRTKPLMSGRDMKLHNWIADRLEAEAPTCTLHAGVSLDAFLMSEPTPEGRNPLTGLSVDLLIADEQGQPVIVLVREDRSNPMGQLTLLDALLDADLPIVDIPNRPSTAQMWSEIAAALPQA